MKYCPDCQGVLEVDISDEYSEVVCYWCGYFVTERFESAPDAFMYINED